MKKMSIAERLKRSIANRKEDFFFTSDFSNLGPRSSVARGLEQLVEKEFLVRVSKGVYVRTQWNKYAKSRVAVLPLSVIAPLALIRMGWKIELGKVAKANAEGKSTQIPNMNIYEIGNQKITRKFDMYGATIYYERNGKFIPPMIEREPKIPPFFKKPDTSWF